MVHANALLASIATLYFYNSTVKFHKGNQSSIEDTHFYVIDKQITNALPLAEASDLNNILYFPKCCPPQYLFQTEKRKCVRNDTVSPVYDDLGFNINIVRSGLSNCEVIVDRQLPEFKLENFENDRTFRFGNDTFAYGKYCLDTSSDGFNGANYVARLCYSKEYCSLNVGSHKDWCLKKCCNDGYVLSGKTCILKSDLGLDIAGNLDVIERNDSIALFTDNRPCRRYEAKKGSFNFSIKANGSFLIYERKVWKEYKVEELMYCMDTNFNATTKIARHVFKLCVISNAGDIKFQFSKPAAVISCICLLISILIYIFVYKLQKIIQMIIVCYCFFLMVFYVLTALVHSIADFGKYCEIVGFTLYFSYIASISWMNILCFDIYTTVGSMKTTRNQSRASMFRKMAWYSLYGISIPSVITLFLYLSHKRVFSLPHYLYPRLIAGNCIIVKRGLGTYGHIVHSVIPVGILICVNVVLFGMTLRYYLQAKNQIQRIAGTSIAGKHKKMQVNRQKIVMVLKLSLVMGISWIFEVISLTISFKQNVILEIIELVFDTFNYLQGLFVFLIFLAKWETAKELASKIGCNKVLRKGQDSQGTHTTSLMLTETGF